MGSNVRIVGIVCGDSGDGGDAETRQVRRRGGGDEGQGFDVIARIRNLVGLEEPSILVSEPSGP